MKDKRKNAGKKCNNVRIDNEGKMLGIHCKRSTFQKTSRQKSRKKAFCDQCERIIYNASEQERKQEKKNQRERERER